MRLGKVPTKAGGGAKQIASLQQGTGIHGNPASGNDHQAPSHWESQ